MPRQDTATIIDRISQTVLRHTVLHMANIFVSFEESKKVTSVIKWQSIPVLPLLLRVRFPEFQDVDPDFVLDLAIPELPQDFETLDAVAKRITVFKTRQTRIAKAYEVASPVHNPQAYKDFFMPSFVQDLFNICGEASEEGITPLRECLIQIAKIWDDIGFGCQCPLNFNDDIQKHNQKFQEYRDFRGIAKLPKSSSILILKAGYPLRSTSR